ncbi:3-oxoacyl-[acyl-carrier-protein] synthase III C-terminal domain-containing protein [Dickeya poaceiphila]|uniref:3-oxoacyl-ACP synthase n=1 Tax=Dickeya poaceiphila TaxID=568768 RepID=A0A5B8IBE6_9GAMM|nr:3-oxoacyl-[acyl-carrier-protein] synthase III C-terminal domain-containing protein [Dickeya poaceiphila]QDX31491.1 3-oxoacyl-ACP synthase [Dickeya poaceiphila]
MLPLNGLYRLHERISLVPVADLASSYDLRAGQCKVLERFYSIKSVAKYVGTHKEMLNAVVHEVVKKNSYLKQETGLLIYAKTQTHNTFFDENWLSDITKMHGIGHWDSMTLSLNHCATALSAIHFLKKTAIRNKKPLILLTGEKAFHKDINKLDNGLLAEIPLALLLNAGQATWNITGSMVRHLPDFHNNHQDKSPSERREYYSTLEDKYAEFYLKSLEKFKLRLDEIDAIVPGNLDIPQLKRAMAKINFQGHLFLENIPEYGHAYCSDIPFNLAVLLKDFNGKRILCVSMGMGITLSGILIEKR